VKLHFLDTSALSDLAEPAHALVRHRLLDEIQAGTIVVLATHPVLWELPGAYGAAPAHFAGMFDLLMRITARRVLLAAPLRIGREVRAGGPLRYPAFVDHERWLVPINDPATLDEAAAYNFGFTHGLAFEEALKADDAVDAINQEARRQALAQGVPYDPDAWPRALKREFRKREYALRLAEDFARTTLERSGGDAGVDVSALNPRALPTPWTSAVIHVARMRAVLIGRTSPTGKKSPGALDLMHLSEAASYADVFVAADRRLRAFARSVVDLLCEVLSFLDWSRRLVGPS
jgi:hypothetical protein